MFEIERELGGTRSRLNLTHLATLLALHHQGTLAAAADSLGYTPGAASQHLTALERTLGVPLTERSGRVLLLTDAGRTLVEHAALLLDAESGAVAAVRTSTGRPAGTLRVGTWGSTAASLLSPVVAAMRGEHPDVSLRAREIDVDAVVGAVQRGEVDVAFGLDYPDAPMARDEDLDVVLLHEESFHVAIARTDPARTDGADRTDRTDDPGVRDATDDELASLDWILPPESSYYGRAFRYACRTRGFEPRVVHELTDTAASLQLAAGGSGATPVTTLMRRLNPGLDVVELRPQQPIRRRVVLVSRRRTQPRAVHQLFTAAVQEAVRDLVDGATEMM